MLSRAEVDELLRLRAAGVARKAVAHELRCSVNAVKAWEARGAWRPHAHAQLSAEAVQELRRRLAELEALPRRAERRRALAADAGISVEVRRASYAHV